MKTSYSDFRIESKGRTYYLRKKTRLPYLTLTIRTQKHGRGRALARVEGNIISRTSEIELLHKLHKKIKFQFVILQDIPNL